jgi:serine/threonine-protein kinase
MWVAQPDEHTPSVVAMTSRPGQLFGYEIIDTVGQGAGSVIYAASDPQTRQIVALKHVVVKCDKDQRFIEQLRAELEVGKKVAHPGLRKSLDLKTKTTWLGKVTEAALIMELVDGTPLDQELPDDLLRLTDCFARTAEALGALHAMGYCHCDLKPANILLGAGGKTKVIDLGQASPLGTKKQRIQGTPDFIAPEQVKCHAVTHQTDVFNLGATMYWCLSGEKMPTLFTAGKGENSFVVNDQIRTPHEIRPRVPENLSNLVMECVKLKPERRPADMAEVARRLEVIRFGMSKGRRVPVA